MIWSFLVDYFVTIQQVYKKFIFCHSDEGGITQCEQIM